MRRLIDELIKTLKIDNVDLEAGDRRSLENDMAKLKEIIDNLPEDANFYETLIGNIQEEKNNDEAEEIGTNYSKLLGKDEFKKRIKMHLEQLRELQDKSVCEVVSCEPITNSKRMGDDLKKSHFRLAKYKIPAQIYKAFDNDKFGSFKLNTPLSEENYIERFKNLLWIEEAFQTIEMHSYDLFDVKFEPCGDKNFLSLRVKGLAEKRPSLIKGNRLYASTMVKGKQKKYEAYIVDVEKKNLIVKFNSRLNLDALIQLKFNVTYLISRIPFRRCHLGVEIFRHNFFKQILFPGLEEADDSRLILEVGNSSTVLEEQISLYNNKLNEHQRAAIMNILGGKSKPAPYVIFGPPGTGKTSTVIETVLQVYTRKENSRILVCANTNTCTDSLATRLLESQVIQIEHLIRLSAFHRMDLIPKNLIDVTLDMDSLSPEIYQNCRILVTTCIQSGSLYEFQDRFDYVFIDEAGHASEPESDICIGLLNYSGLLVLAGDYRQIGPFVLSPIAKTCGLYESFLERLSMRPMYRRLESPTDYDARYLTKLKISYRSDGRVLRVCNELFYNNDLKFVVKTPKKLMKLLGAKLPVGFHAIEGKELRDKLSPSWYNLSEALKCLYYVQLFYKAGKRPNQIGIITPYRLQIIKLNILFREYKMKPCKIATVEEFQGDEREIIIVSTVRTSEKNVKRDRRFGMGFLFDPKRFNVAVTRAKHILIVIGDEGALTRDPCWKKFIEYSCRLDDKSEGNSKSN